MTVDRWLAAAIADAERRGLPELKPLLEGLAAATTALRAADWNDRADGAAPPAPSTQPQAQR
jgi:hypothetical protein